MKGGEAVRFHPSPALDAADVDDVLLTVKAYVQRLLGGSGADASDEGGDSLDGWADDAPVLAGLAAASVAGRTALGPRAGARVRRCGEARATTEPPGLGPCHAPPGGPSWSSSAPPSGRAGARDPTTPRIRTPARRIDPTGATITGRS